MKAVLPALARPLVEPHIPAGIDVAWFTTREEAIAMEQELATRLRDRGYTVYGGH